ncbi:MAG: 2-oxoacid:acceptor oxidoreductase family protein [Deferribacterota bacterium]|nr:2-oxoacid:acceptor oxidoreductase family protein [Deferribacterota bacterium]
MGRDEIRLSGSGGQGMITAGIILGLAAAVYEGKNAITTKSYGPEARGGAARSEVIISDDEIFYPKVLEPNIMVALTQESIDKYTDDLKEDAIVIYDSFIVKNVPDKKVKYYPAPIIKAAAEEVGKTIVANILSLGVLNEICGIARDESLLNAVLSRVPKGTEELNKKALEVGKRIGKDIKG